jgi:hypothetical protein
LVYRLIFPSRIMSQFFSMASIITASF